MLLPYDEKLTLDENDRQLFERIEEWVDQRPAADGYAVVETERGMGVLFFRAGRTYCAGELIDGHFATRSVTDFMRIVPHARTAAYYAVSLPLFICTVVLFRKAPTTSVPLDARGAQALMEALAVETRDAVLAIRSQRYLTLVLCKRGRIEAVFSADPAFRAGADPTGQLVTYVEQIGNAGAVVADLYTDIELPPASDAGMPVAPLDLDVAERADLALLISLSGRPVFYYAMSQDTILVGRGLENDLALDSVSVSRRHARFIREGTTLRVEDVGGENGILWRGERVIEATLRPGDEVTIGTYTVFYSPTHDVARVAGQVVPASSPSAALHATMAIGDRSLAAELRCGEKTFPLKVPMFLIGKSVHAHCHIDGFLVQPVHAEIQRIAGGAHRLQRVGKWRRLFVAGRPVQSVDLRHGMRFTIAGQTFEYALPGRQPAAPTTDIASPHLR